MNNQPTNNNHNRHHRQRNRTPSDSLHSQNTSVPFSLSRKFDPTSFERRKPQSSSSSSSSSSINRPTTCLSINPSTHQTLLGSADHAAYTFDIQTTKPLRRLYSRHHGHIDWVSCCAFLRDGRPITGGMDGKLCLWDVSGSRCTDLIGSQVSVSDVQNVPNREDGGRVAVISSGYDGSLCVWNVSGSRVVFDKIENKTKRLPPLTGFAISSSLKALSCSRNGMVSVWDCGKERGSVVKAVAGKHHLPVKAILSAEDHDNYSHSSDVFATGGLDGIVALWDCRQKLGVSSSSSGSCRSKIGATVAVRPHEKRSNRNLAVAPIGALIAWKKGVGSSGSVSYLLSGNVNGDLLLLDPRRNLMPAKSYPSCESGIESLCIGENDGTNQLLFCGMEDGTVMAHDVASGSLVRKSCVGRGNARFLATTEHYFVVSGQDGCATVFSHGSK